jgi:peptidoglycan/xylan/chitin deacetylase (PgdA/CDA1 family)
MLRVLIYHRIADPESSPRLDPALVSATPDVFKQQMQYLAARFRVVSLSDVLRAFQKGTALPEDAVLVTFDDAYADFGTTAWPILKSLGLPAALFVPTAYPDSPNQLFWWDRLYCAVTSTTRPELESSPFGTMSLRTREDRLETFRRLREHLKNSAHQEVMRVVDETCDRLGGVPLTTNGVLSWDELRTLSSEGVALAAHTRTHPLLTRIASDAAREEIVGSQRDLEHHIGDTVPVFCFPGGQHNDTLVSILKQEGFKLAFTTVRGSNDLECADPWRLRRINITRTTSPLMFRLRLTGLGVQVDAWRHARRRRRLH